jgi:hypothetical protein
MKNQNKRKPNIIASIILFTLILMLFGFIFTNKNIYKLDKGISTIILSFYILIIGVLFLISYHYPNSNYLFKAFNWVCNNSIGSNKEKSAFYYFGISVLLFIVGLLYGLGIFHQ